MDDYHTDIDLPPNKWRSNDDRPKPKEPIFGPGWPWFLGLLIGIFGAAFALESGYGPFGSTSAGTIGAIIGRAIGDIIH